MRFHFLLVSLYVQLYLLPDWTFHSHSLHGYVGEDWWTSRSRIYDGAVIKRRAGLFQPPDGLLFASLVITMNALVYFLEKYVWRFGMFTLVLLALENILDDYFVCPCEDEHNHVICTFYGFVPALACLIFTIFVDLSSKEWRGGVLQVWRGKSPVLCSHSAYLGVSVFPRRPIPGLCAFRLGRCVH